jgi:hypothetical protein
MKLTPYGFVCRAETFVKDALSLPPRGGGEWTTQRLVNFMEQTGSLQILLNPGTGVAKPSAILRSRATGGPRDKGLQGWVEYPSSDSREAFVLREGDADRAMEEIFDIVERVLSKIPEWDTSASFVRPEPPPRAFEPLIPEIQNPAEETAPVEAPTSENAAAAEAVADFPDTQSMVDSLLSPGNFEEPPAETVEAAVEPEPAAAVEPAPAEEPEKPAKKGRGRKAKG